MLNAKVSSVTSLLSQLLLLFWRGTRGRGRRLATNCLREGREDVVRIPMLLHLAQLLIVIAKVTPLPILTKVAFQNVIEAE